MDKRFTVNNLANGGSVAKQVEAAKRQLESWPDWMRKAGRFEGADVPNSDRDKRFTVNNLAEAKKWYADAKPQHLPIKVATNGVATLVLSKSGHVLRRD